MRKDAAWLAVLVTVLLLILPAPGRAGTYDVVSCGVEAGGENLAWKLEPYNSAGKTPPDPAAFVVSSNAGDTEKCRVDINPVVAKRTVKVDDGAGLTFRAPAGTLIKRVRLSRNVSARASTDDPASPAQENGVWAVTARIGSSVGGQRVLAPESCTGNPLTPDAYCTVPPGGPGAEVAYEIGEPVMSWGFQCVGPTVNSLCFTGTGTGTGANAGLSLHWARVTVEDLVAPAVSAGLPDSGFRRPSDPIPAAASDTAGVRSLRVLVDGVERFADQLPCDYRLPAPCSAEAAKTYDLAGVPDGRHTVTTIAEDAASNLTRIERIVDVDGTGPAIDHVPVSGRRISAVVSDRLSGLRSGTIEARRNARAAFVALKTTLRGGRLVATVPRSMNPARIGIRVTATDRAANTVTAVVTSMSLSTRTGPRFRKVRNGRANVPYGRAVIASGRLTTTDGAPVAYQPILVAGTLRQAGARPQPLTSATTDATGRFRFSVPAGPSRELSVTYPGAPGVLHRSRDLWLRTQASSTIRASTTVVRGAGSVRFSGRLGLLGAALPPGGKIVELQAAQRGRWTTVSTARASGPNATWRAVARFRGNPGRFPVRLRIRREAGVFPYELGYSRPVVVHVR